jgi:glycosyltransferase involved in cell wall biosynthesis
VRVTFLTWRDTGHPDGGGSEEYVEHVAAGLARRGHDVTVMCAAYPGSVPDETRAGVRFRRRGGRLTVYLHGLAFVTVGRGRRSHAIVEVVNGIPFGAGLVRRRLTVPLVHHLHREQWRMIYPGWRGRLGWGIERTTVRAYRRLRFLTVSQATAADLTDLGVPRASVHVVPNGAEQRPLREPAGEGPVLCTLSRVVPHKQLEHAVDAVVALAPRHPGLRLRVIGSGWWEHELRQYVVDARASELVELCGRVDADERDLLLASSVAMLLPSVREGWGLAVIEAALQGTPTVAYRSAGGVTESIRDGVTGLLVDTPRELTRAAGTLLDDPALRARLSGACRDWALSFDWERSADDVERLLKERAGDQVAGEP